MAPTYPLVMEAERLYGMMPAAVRRALPFPVLDSGERLEVKVIGDEFARLHRNYFGVAPQGLPPGRAQAAALAAARLAALLIERRSWSDAWIAYRRGDEPLNEEIRQAKRQLRADGKARYWVWEIEELVKSGRFGSELVELARSVAPGDDAAHLALAVRDYGEPHFVPLADKVAALRAAIARAERPGAVGFMGHLLGLFREEIAPSYAAARDADEVVIRASRQFAWERGRVGASTGRR